MVNGPEQVGQGGSGVNPFGGINNDKLAAAQERLANFKKANQGISLFSGDRSALFESGASGNISKGGSIFGQR